jgi:aminocarboxymuconate-semialdehyde decarboxylase
VIDVHAHVVLDMVLGAAGQAGPELWEEDGQQRFRVGGYTLCGVRYRGSLFMDVERRLAAMDEAGITVQALSPNPLTYLHHIPVRDAVDYCRRHNDALAAIVDAHPGRFVGFVSLPMQDLPAALTELERAVTDGRLVGPYIGTDFGRPLDDERLDDLYAACVALDVPLFLHPAPSGIDGPLRDQRLRRFDLDLTLEFAYEETLAVALLVFGGVLHRHQALDVCLSHGGGATAFLLPKLRLAAERRPSAPAWLQEPGAFDADVRRLWFDAHVTDRANLALLEARVGPDHLVAGTNFGGWDAGSALHMGPPLSERLDANARRLLRLPSAMGTWSDG